MTQPAVQIEIFGQQVTRIEYRGQQVVTFAMIDALHNRPKETAQKRFNENKDRFKQREDYFEPTSSEIRMMSAAGLIPERTARLKLLTQRGYLKVTRSFKDDQSWAIFDEMLDRYFIVEAALEDFTGQGQLDLDSDDGLKAFRSEVTRSGSLLSRNIDGVKLTLLGYLSKNIATGISHVGEAVSDLYQRTGKGLLTINNNVKAVNARLEDLDARLLPPSGDRPIILSEWYGCARIYRDLYGVEHVARQGMLSAAVSRSLDSFVLKHRQNYHMTIIDIATKPTKAWHEASVRPWFDQVGRRMIESHLNRFSAPLLERTAP